MRCHVPFTANDCTTARTIVEIKASDLLFFSERCGTWSDDLSPITPIPTAAFEDGTYVVGSKFGPGLWTNSSSVDSCYWERLSGFGGEIDDINDNEFACDGQLVRISPGDVGFSTSGCGIWTRIGD